MKTLTVQEYARMKNITTAGVYDKIKRGTLKTIKKSIRPQLLIIVEE